MRQLTEQEINCLERNRCTAEDWTLLSVSQEGFCADRLSDVTFIGRCSVGKTDGMVATDIGVLLPAGIRKVRVINSTIGDNCLVENVAGFIYNADIEDGCLVCNVTTIQTTEGTSFGQGNSISVLNEAGEGNVVLYAGLTSQVAAITALPPFLGEGRTLGKAAMEQRRQAKEAIRRMVMEEVMRTVPKRTLIESNARIQNCQEITNAWITEGTEIRGAQRISDSTLMSQSDNTVFVGQGVILDGCVVTGGSSVNNNVVAKNCFVGECSTLTDGFSATDSLFFANSYMANGEACAAFCGPFSASHHKSTLLIGGMFSFYNAGSNTNFSNHAYKMGPIHYGMLEHGAKTASGAHILWPARIGAFSMCMGKISNHPNTTALPFSYVIGDGTETYVVPGRNLATVGTYRDVKKWPKRDVRPANCRYSGVDTSWLNVYTVAKMLAAKQMLELIADQQGNKAEVYELNDGSLVKNSSLQKGVTLYATALKMFIADKLNPEEEFGHVADAEKLEMVTDCVDLAGMLVTKSGVTDIVARVLSGDIDTLADLSEALCRIQLQSGCKAEQWLALKVANDLYGWDSMDKDDRLDLIDSCRAAQREWVAMIRQDAEKEYKMGDVENETLEAFLDSLQ